MVDGRRHGSIIGSRASRLRQVRCLRLAPGDDGRVWMIFSAAISQRYVLWNGPVIDEAVSAVFHELAANQGKPYLVQTIWDPAQKGCAYGLSSYDCKTQAAACGSWQCGTAPDGSGGTYECGGGCLSAQTCNASTHTCQGGCPRGFVDCGDGRVREEGHLVRLTERRGRP
jgi:hypothetical protein